MKEDIENALQVLKSGGIIVYPTDTIWGIGCDATNAEAVAKVYRLKQRIDSKALIMLVGSEAQLEQYVENVPEVAWQLIDAAVNPITIVYDHPVGIAENLVASDGSAGFRLTRDPFCAELCRRLRKPLVSTSANISGHKSPRCFADIEEEILSDADYVVNHRRNECGNASPSNIIKLGDSGLVKVIR